MALHRSCGILVFRQRGRRPREYLLLRYLGGHWDFPKGHIEQGESETQTALRELQEETGIDAVRFVDGFRRIIRYQYRNQREGFVQKEVVFFGGRADADRIQLSDEHRGYKWLPYAQAIRQVTFANARRLLRALEGHMRRGPDPTRTEAPGSRAPR